MDGDAEAPAGDMPRSVEGGRWHVATPLVPPKRAAAPASVPPPLPLDAAAAGVIEPGAPAPHVAEPRLEPESEAARTTQDPASPAPPEPSEPLDAPPYALEPEPQPRVEPERPAPAPVPPFFGAPAPAPPPAPTSARRGLPWIIAAVVAGLLLFAIGVVIGLAIRKGDVDEARDAQHAAEQQASSVQAAAKAQAGQVSTLQQQLAARDAQIAALQGSTTTTAPPSGTTPTTQTPPTTPTTPLPVTSADSFGDGLYEVGADVQPGDYRAEGGPACYWAKLTSSDTNNVVVNNLSEGPQTVTIDSPYFVTDGCGIWTKLG